MVSQDRAGWFVFGATIALVLGLAVSSIMLPQSNVIYCTEGFGTCIVRPPRGNWRVLVNAPCTAGQSLRPASLGGLQLRSSFDPGDGLFDTPTRLPCRLCEVVPPVCLWATEAASSRDTPILLIGGSKLGCHRRAELVDDQGDQIAGHLPIEHLLVLSGEDMRIAGHLPWTGCRTRTSISAVPGSGVL